MSCQSYQIDLRRVLIWLKISWPPQSGNRSTGTSAAIISSISSTNTQYSDIRFRHLLLPLWISAYHYNNKNYRFLINARTGAVRGERPYSIFKIVAFVAAIASAIAMLALLLSHGHH